MVDRLGGFVCALHFFSLCSPHHRNVLFNFCRESSDHAPFNSWNRQVYVFDTASEKNTTRKMNDTITRNWILGNYHSSMAVDNDDGSSFFDTHHNVLISDPSNASSGGFSLKSDFGGHSNFHHNNLDLFFKLGFQITAQLPGFNDAYYDNYLWLSSGGNGEYGSGQTCEGGAKTFVGGNTIFTASGNNNNLTECGVALSSWQNEGNDVGTRVVSPYPSVRTVVALAQKILLTTSEQQ